MPSARPHTDLARRLAYATCTLGISLSFVFWPADEVVLPQESTPLTAQTRSALPATTARETPLPAFTSDLAHQFDFAQEGVLGTSFDLRVIADNRGIAEAVESRILKEIDHRESLIRTYRTNSEISRLNRLPFKAGERVPVSLSLWLLLDECNYVSRESDGAFNAFAGEVTRLWTRAANRNTAPDPKLMSRATAAARSGFRLSGRKEDKWIQRLASGFFDFNAIGKGYIIDKCVREAVDDFPTIRGLRLDIGGEIKVWGQSDYARNRPWTIGVADPLNPADNAPPLTRLELRNLAVATSGDYARARRVGRREVNHVFDPRTGEPVDHVRSATVIALDAQRADALATALCVMPPSTGIAMVDRLPDAACILVTASGEQLRSGSFAAMERRDIERGAPTWPKNHVVNLEFQLVRSETRAPFHRHYVGAWVADEHGRRVRILALWAKPNDIRYVRDLDLFWRDAWVLAGEGEDTRKMLGFTRATRPPGRYTLTWDGLDDAGRPVPRGRYTLHLDVNREKGPPNSREQHTHAAVELLCAGESQSATGTDQPELRNVIATYGPVGGDR